MKAVYDFSEASGSNKKLLGGKGAGLSEMTRLKLAVPPGFVITTEVCKDISHLWVLICQKNGVYDFSEAKKQDSYWMH